MGIFTSPFQQYVFISKYAHVFIPSQIPRPLHTRKSSIHCVCERVWQCVRMCVCVCCVCVLCWLALFSTFPHNNTRIAWFSGSSPGLPAYCQGNKCVMSRNKDHNLIPRPHSGNEAGDQCEIKAGMCHSHGPTSTPQSWVVDTRECIPLAQMQYSECSGETHHGG